MIKLYWIAQKAVVICGKKWAVKKKIFFYKNKSPTERYLRNFEQGFVLNCYIASPRFLLINNYLFVIN